MAGKQQRDYWGDMSRRGDVRYIVSCGDKDDQLLTPLHFNCQNKKLVQASCVFLLRRETRKWAVTGKNVHTMRCDGVSDWKAYTVCIESYAQYIYEVSKRADKFKMQIQCPTKVYYQTLYKGPQNTIYELTGRPSANICTAYNFRINICNLYISIHQELTRTNHFQVVTWI